MASFIENGNFRISSLLWPSVFQASESRSFFLFVWWSIDDDYGNFGILIGYSDAEDLNSDFIRFWHRVGRSFYNMVADPGLLL